MVHALAWSESLEIRERIKALRDEHLAPEGWGSLDDGTVLKVVKADTDVDLYDRSAEAVSLRIKEEPQRLDSAVRRLAQTAELLRRLGVRSWSLVPYRLQPVLVAAALDGVMFADAVEDCVVDWFWLTTYGEMFAGLSGYRIAQALSDLRLAMQDGRVRWSGAKPLQLRGLPRATDFKNVRIKALALRLAQAQHDVAITPGDPFELLASYGRHALVGLLTTRRASRVSCSSPANRFLCPPHELTELRRRIFEGEIDPCLAQAHLIPQASVDAARAGDWDRFVTGRRSFIEAQERAFVNKLLAKHEIKPG